MFPRKTSYSRKASKDGATGLKVKLLRLTGFFSSSTSTHPRGAQRRGNIRLAKPNARAIFNKLALAKCGSQARNPFSMPVLSPSCLIGQPMAWAMVTQRLAIGVPLVC